MPAGASQADGRKGRHAVPPSTTPDTAASPNEIPAKGSRTNVQRRARGERCTPEVPSVQAQGFVGAPGLGAGTSTFGASSFGAAGASVGFVSGVLGAEAPGAVGAAGPSLGAVGC